MPREPGRDGGDAGATEPVDGGADSFDLPTEDADREVSPAWAAAHRPRLEPRPFADDSLEHPPRVGPYRILGVLGRGGMGVVYRGEHEETGEPAAVKTVNAAVETALSSIRREIHALGRLRHPGIVRIKAEGVSAGLPWYAMQLLHGSTLHDCIVDVWRAPGFERASTTVEVPSTLAVPPPVAAPEPDAPRRPPTPSLGSLLSLAHRLCAPLAFLHGSGLVHRDLKPENIFVRDDGRPVLVDLGIAARFGGARGREELFADKKVMGSAHYIAPEQILGELVDARADLYALGCILYECVTGRPPFLGSPSASVLYQHLLEEPAAPSRRVEGVPAALDRLILQLLEKRPQDRLGYADDVAAALAALGVGGATERAPRAHAYVYRPEFIGRSEALATIDAALERLKRDRRGGIVLVRGESGVGKTRLSMELARAATRRDLTVITGQCAALAVGEAAFAAPLHPLRPLLQTVAARCGEGGAAEAERLLGPRARVLAPYEPALLGLPDQAELPIAPTPPPEVARARVIDSLEATLFALAEREPVVLVLDDLQWADELSLSFLSALGATGLGERGVLLVGAYRMEESRPELDALAQAQGSVVVALDRLDTADVGAMVSGMLALREPPATLVDFLSSRSSGNPFFVAEYLHATIAVGMLARDGAGRWQFHERGATADALLALPLPETLAELFDRRLGGLDGEGRALVAWAAVLGRELDGDLLANAEDTAGMEAIEALRVRQILEEVAGGRLRFVHDKIREIAYERLGAGERRDLHRRAAEALEARGVDSDAVGAIAHHFALAGTHEKASRYFAHAADGARARYANGEAIASYRSAIEEGRAAREEGAADVALEPPAALHERLGEVLVLTGRQEDGRAAFAAALACTAAEARAERARLHRKLGRTWEAHSAHEEALAAYDAAERALGEDPAGDVEAIWHEWVQVQSARISVHYFLAQVDRIRPLIDAVRPLVEARGTPQQRYELYGALVRLNVRAERFLTSSETGEYARASLAAAEEAADSEAIAEARFNLAVVLLCGGALGEAEALLLATREVADRIGDATLQAQCLTYLAQTFRRQGRAAETRAAAERALAIAEAAGMTGYVGAALANLAWVAWREGRSDDAERQARQALSQWSETSFVFPFHWLALLPLAATALARGDAGGAIECLRSLSDPGQARLPPALATAIEESAAARDGADAAGEYDSAQRAVAVATALSLL